MIMRVSSWDSERRESKGEGAAGFCKAGVLLRAKI